MEELDVAVSENEKGELVITFPKKVLDALKLQPGDTVIWTRDENGVVSVKKATPV